MKSILIVAAGTGGHVFPALAVAQQLQQQGWQVTWLGTNERRLEASVVPRAGIPLETIDMQGLRGHGLLRKVLMPWRLMRATFSCMRIMRRLQPQLVLTFGGYVCAPAGLAARCQRRPLLVHEQNAVPGMTTRLLSRFAQLIMLGMPQAQRYLPQAQITGNPLRAELLARAKQAVEPSAQQRILVVGGSLGARALNEHVPAALQQLAQRWPLQIVHQCGQQAVAEVQQRYRALTSVTVVPFIDDMASAYQHADIVICRAGALTVAELALLGRPAIFIPLPQAVDDHQTINTQLMVDAGAAKLLPQSELSSAKLVELLEPLFAEPERLREMAVAAQRAAYPEATQRVVDYCETWRKSS
ncbi:undecaprenyldiphospho-muramoylpentapeptide beta-N-acetylglucosaminyltransferase [Idiomarina xiamenensis]|uniref:UDP-N-acetylglucosamine--N-acetylmuramyl-(pentapeptide) pyrophosphoryl-undecaprenol N-acetylglucosamine transferase n=1 Tax=Idiomarina xiamenensis 10-D-4 TaxID=740709 RepID=K2KSG2_9GAMM|nr:undecaprenyldiphospho-muramoylpentapeptide beta-N-acetylglucosaminyltransferase [Idiomarina xiamenensis]EKE85334.1 UDP-N-acetylglucosamine:LPS N-acetylglucosamine transferase [Idiomarina xiamenensis 10-D-4]